MLSIVTVLPLTDGFYQGYFLVVQYAEYQKYGDDIENNISQKWSFHHAEWFGYYHSSSDHGGQKYTRT